MSSVVEQRDFIINTITSFTGQYGYTKEWVDNFDFRVGTTPLSNMVYPITTVIVYCIFIPSLAKFMENRKAPSLRGVLFLHNLFLVFMSAFVAYLMILQLLSIQYLNNYNNFTVYCGLTYYDQKGLLTLLYYVNHLLKYYELIDTIFLAIKKRPLGFLHCYHHPATLVLTWGQLVDSTGVQWVVILLNLFVHTVMYTYYGLAAIRIRMPFKISITIMQITQFVIDLVACYYAWYQLCFNRKSCFGTWRAGFVGCFILTSYLYLFVDFFKDTYCKAKKPKKLKEN